MRKLIRFLTAVCFMLLLSFTVNAETFEITMSVEKTGTKYVYLDAFVDSENPICGGEFTLSFDEESVCFSDVESDVFDVEASEYNGAVRIIVAKGEEIKTDDNKPTFCVQLSASEKEDFSVTLKTEYIINEMFEKITPENNCATVEIDGDSVSVSDEFQKAKASESNEKDKSDINEKVSVDKETDISTDKNTDTKSLLPIKINGKDRGIGLLLAVGLLFVVAFLFGLFFKKIMTSKEEEEPTNLF